jgi:hypothetical protein
MLPVAMIEQVSLDAFLLRNLLPEFNLREGMSVVARVASRAEAHGVIMLAGVPLTAKLPPEVQAGQTLHLKVAEITPEQVTLRLDSEAAALVAQPPPPAPQPPRIAVEEPPRRGAGGEESATVALSFDSAVLGRLDLRIDLARGSVTAGITATSGPALELATAAAAQLESALADKIGRAAHVRVTPRREPFDAYA